MSRHRLSESQRDKLKETGAIIAVSVMMAMFGFHLAGISIIAALVLTICGAIVMLTGVVLELFGADHLTSCRYMLFGFAVAVGAPCGLLFCIAAIPA